MGLIQKDAPLQEPINLLQAKVFLRIDGDQEDELLGRLIKTARQAIESYTVRSFIRQSWTFSFNGGFGQTRSDATYLSGAHSRGQGGIELPRSPFIELIGNPVIENRHGRREIETYRLDTAGRMARLHLESLGADLMQDQSVISVSFWAGYGGEPEDVPEPIRQAILMTVANLYEGRHVANDTGLISAPLSEGVVQLIKPYRVGIFRI